MFEAIGIGDLHLTSSIGKGGLSSYVKDHDRAVAYVVDRALQYATKNEIRHVFLYGDLCEAPRMSYDAQLALLSMIRQDFQFHIILGNHDKFGELSSAGHSLQIIKEFQLPNVRVYEEPTLRKIDGAPIHFMPWPCEDFNPKALNVAHVDVPGAKTDSGRAVTKGIVSKAPSVIGHIHTMQKVRNTHYSGTLYQTNFGEAQDKYFHHIKFEDGEWQVENVPSKPKYILHTVEAKTRKDLARLRKTLPEAELANHLIKVILLEGNNITATDYEDLNVVKTVSVNSDRELVLARIEDLTEGSAIDLSTNEFFQEWLDTKSVDPSERKSIAAFRTYLLKKAYK